MYRKNDNERFKACRRTALDGKVLWCVWDRILNRFSTYTCHHVYRTRHDCNSSIAYYNKAWNLPHLIR